MEKSLAQSSNETAVDVNNSSINNNLQDETSIAVANLTNLLDIPGSELENDTRSSIQVNLLPSVFHKNYTNYKLILTYFTLSSIIGLIKISCRLLLCHGR